MKLRRRWQSHIMVARHGTSKSAIHAAIRLYGIESFAIEMIQEVSDRKIACALEIELIASEGTLSPNGYNLTPGGDGGQVPGHRHSAEARAKMSAAALGKPKSPEAVARMRAALTGRKAGPARSALSREIGLRNKGKKRSTKDKALSRVRRRREAIKTGNKGVYRLPSGNFRVRISCEGKRRGLGSYPTYKEAETVYDSAVAEHLATLLNHIHDPDSLVPAQERYATDLMPYDSARRTAQRKKDWAKRHARSQQNQGTLL